MRRLALLSLMFTLSACGSRTPLEPPAGSQLPVAPHGGDARPTSSELLRVPPQAQPDRNVELRKRSETRADDPFDLPPP